MLWKNSQLLGCAISRNKNGASFIVAKYYPRGNILSSGAFAKNVGNITEFKKPLANFSTPKEFSTNSTMKTSLLKYSTETLFNYIFSFDSKSEVKATKLPDHSKIIPATTTGENLVIKSFSDRTTSSKNNVTTNFFQTVPASTQLEDFTDLISVTDSNTINNSAMFISREKYITENATEHKKSYITNISNITDIPILTSVIQESFKELNAKINLNITNFVSTIKTVNNTKTNVLSYNFSNNCLFAHNYFRKVHGVENLQLDEKLQFEAQE